MTLGPRIGSPTPLLVIGTFLLLFGLGFIGPATYFILKSASLAQSGEVAQGAVFANKESKGNSTPVVDFTTPAGQQVRFVGNMSSHPPVYQVGEKVRVLYLPADPSTHAIDSFREMWFIPSVLMPIGIAAALGGAVMVLKGIGRQRARTRIKANGLHLPAVVVGAALVGEKDPQYDPEVEARDPHTGAPLRCTADRQKHRPVIGSRAVVHVESVPPHGHFVELG